MKLVKISIWLLPTSLTTCFKAFRTNQTHVCSCFDWNPIHTVRWCSTTTKRNIERTITTSMHGQTSFLMTAGVLSSPQSITTCQRWCLISIVSALASNPKHFRTRQRFITVSIPYTCHNGPSMSLILSEWCVNLLKASMLQRTLACGLTRSSALTRDLMRKWQSSPTIFMKNGTQVLKTGKWLRINSISWST